MKEPVLISFKVSQEVARQLEALSNGQSLHLTAKGIVLENIGQAKPKSTVEERLESVEIQLSELKKLYP